MNFTTQFYQKKWSAIVINLDKTVANKRCYENQRKDKESVFNKIQQLIIEFSEYRLLKAGFIIFVP